MDYFGHVERICDERITKQIYKAALPKGTTRKGLPRRIFIKEISNILKKDQIKIDVCMKRCIDVSEPLSAYPYDKQAYIGMYICIKFFTVFSQIIKPKFF